MLSTPADAAAYLLERGYIDPSAVVEGALSIADVSQRNRNYRVVSRAGPSYLVKQTIAGLEGVSVEREAAVYEWLASAANASMHAYLPRLHAYDAGAGVLLLDFVHGEGLDAIVEREGRLPPGVATALGEALATLHRLPLPGDDRFSQPPAWALALHRPSVAVLRDVSAGGLQVIRTLQRHPDLCAAVDEVRAAWRPGAFVHFDLKWDNCLVLPAPGAALRLVDWESAGVGDPAWDAGSVFANFLDAWLTSIPIAPDTPVERLPALARHPLEAMHPDIRDFWTAYAAAAAPAEATDRLLRSLRYAAVRLLEAAFARSQPLAAPAAHAPLLLQLAVNILRRPEQATALIGLDATVRA